MKRFLPFFSLVLCLLSGATTAAAQSEASSSADKAQAVIAKAVQALGGGRYLQIKTQVGRGKYSILHAGGVGSFQTFIDIVVYPDKGRTEFKGGGSRTIQVNTGDSGWVFDGDQDLIKVQTPTQVANFKKGLRTSIDNLLREQWKGEAELTYVGRRPASLGKRNDVVRLKFEDGFEVEFEFADDGLPQKALYKNITAGGDDVKEEDRYAQFIDVGGIRAPFVIDRFSNGSHYSRINYESVEFNKSISASIFTKPLSSKDAKKEIKY